MRLAGKVLQDVARDLTDTLGVKECLAVLGATELEFILLLLDLLEAWTHVIIVDLELQYLFIAYSIGDDVLV